MLVRRLRKEKPDIVVSVMGYVNLALLAARGLLPNETKLIVREANVLSATKAAFPRWLPTEKLYQRLYPRADAIIAPTQMIAREIEQAAPAAASRIVMMQNPVDETRQRSRAERIIRLPVEGLNVVAAGRLTRQKGFDRLIALMPQLPAAHLTIFGEGPERAALEKQIDGLDLKGRISLSGFSDNLSSAIAGADVFVLPSRWEGLPNVVLEALALGTPVVASNESCVEDIAAQTAHGALTVAPVDAAFARAIMQHKPAPISAPRPSLLPEVYRVENVAKRFDALLSRVAQSAL
jgi:glycosyltransferase involved in cell wall biosynthesis